LSYKVDKCNETYVAKWELIDHVKKVDQFIIEKGNFGAPFKS
jgi:hypothetical protein